MKILISDAFDPSLPGRLTKFGEVFDDKGRQSEAEAVLVRSKTKCTKEYIDATPDLKLIIRGGVGIDNIDVEYAKSKGIEVRNTPTASELSPATPPSSTRADTAGAAAPTVRPSSRNSFNKGGRTAG